MCGFVGLLILAFALSALASVCGMIVGRVRNSVRWGMLATAIAAVLIPAAAIGYLHARDPRHQELWGLLVPYLVVALPYSIWQTRWDVRRALEKRRRRREPSEMPPSGS